MELSLTTEENDLTKKRERTLKNYASHLLVDSLLTGVSPLVKIQSVPRKILKTAVLVCCLVGFIYQTTDFVSIFLDYPTVQDVQLVVPEKYLMPAVTFCNSNSIRRSKFCKLYPKKCEVPKNMTHFCYQYPHYCTNNVNLRNFMMPKIDAYKIERHFTLDDLEQMGHDIRPFAQISYPKENITGPMRFPRLEVEDEFYPIFHACYSLYSRVNSSQEALTTTFKRTWRRNRPLFFKFNFEPHEYFRPDLKPRGLFAIHSPFVAVNPYDSGFFVEPGKNYKIYLKLREEQLLPYPYHTDCVNYTKEWIKNGRIGVRSKQMCAHACAVDRMIEQCGCVRPEVVIPHEEKLCEIEEDVCIVQKAAKTTGCFRECKQDCLSTSFAYEVKERDVERQNFGPGDPRSYMSQVGVFFRDPEITVYKYSPKYENVEVFSYIGGYIGVWLGMSLVAVFDFVETLGLIISFCIWPKRSRQLNKSAQEF